MNRRVEWLFLVIGLLIWSQTGYCQSESGESDVSSGNSTQLIAEVYSGTLESPENSTETKTTEAIITTQETTSTTTTNKPAVKTTKKPKKPKTKTRKPKKPTKPKKPKKPKKPIRWHKMSTNELYRHARKIYIALKKDVNKMASNIEELYKEELRLRANNKKNKG
ncbi:hypothetical protein ACFFRR_004632 [Megaselia abdita]